MVALDDRSWTRCLSIGERRGSNAGGGRGDAKAVGKQASSGGSRLRGLGGGMYWTMVKNRAVRISYSKFNNACTPIGRF